MSEIDYQVKEAARWAMCSENNPVHSRRAVSLAGCLPRFIFPNIDQTLRATPQVSVEPAATLTLPCLTPSSSITITHYYHLQLSYSLSQKIRHLHDLSLADNVA